MMLNVQIPGRLNSAQSWSWGFYFNPGSHFPVNAATPIMPPCRGGRMLWSGAPQILVFERGLVSVTQQVSVGPKTALLWNYFYPGDMSMHMHYATL